MQGYGLVGFVLSLKEGWGNILINTFSKTLEKGLEREIHQQERIKLLLGSKHKAAVGTAFLRAEQTANYQGVVRESR